jgi:hypothetical protein
MKEGYLLRLYGALVGVVLTPIKFAESRNASIETTILLDF